MRQSDKRKLSSYLSNRPSIPALQLVEVCLRSSYFQFQDFYYEQVDGTAMGSPLSLIIANLYMERLEEATISSASFKSGL